MSKDIDEQIKADLDKWGHNPTRPNSRTFAPAPLCKTCKGTGQHGPLPGYRPGCIDCDGTGYVISTARGKEPMTEHTSGPWNWTADGWIVGPERPHKQDHTIGLDPGQHLAPVCDRIAYVKCPTYEQQDANARLIASAPDLLAALERCLPFVEEHMIMTSVEDVGFADAAAHAAGRAAIAKARGQ